ncbi:hypothetical protein GCM10022214_52040 [Actinomadura miaoliensis]|uniref:Uncharacterized protein n=1 Tax=Actinomadura miaoliensis TaxID=430685 RepID=A0ABP7WBV7_9ACTN
MDDRSCATSASAERLWQVVEGIGGEHGWYSFPLAWWVRGVIDRLVGGVGPAAGPPRLQAAARRLLAR